PTLFRSLPGRGGHRSQPRRCNAFCCWRSPIYATRRKGPHPWTGNKSSSDVSNLGPGEGPPPESRKETRCAVRPRETRRPRQRERNPGRSRHGAVRCRRSLTTGKKLSLDQANGNYILTVSVSSFETKQNSFGTLNFKVLDTPPGPEPWDVLEPGIAEDAGRGVLDQQRGLCYWALGQVDEARAWFRRALKTDDSNEIARARLVDAYYSKKDYAAVVSLYSDAGITEHTDSETLLRIATSLDKNGKT